MKMKKQTVHEEMKPAATYRKLLLAKKEEVLSSLGLQFDALAAVGRVGEEDQAQIIHDEFISLHLNSMDYAKLRDVTEALDRLDAGDYGICANCEDRIPANRLDALPWAKYCRQCQSDLATPVPEETPELASTGHSAWH
jgi:DnaK suppressor protein